MVNAMRFDRVVISVDLSLLLSVCPWYVRASDGLWVPKCDLLQYEAGQRPIR